MGDSSQAGVGLRTRGAEGERAAVLVEAAIVTPLLLLLLFGVWTTARAWNVHNVLDHAAREAARYGAADANHTNISTVAEGEVIAASVPWANVNFCSSIIESGSGSLHNGSAGTCMSAGSGPGQDPTTDDRVQVTLTISAYQLDFLFFSSTVDLQARAVARLEP